MNLLECIIAFCFVMVIVRSLIAIVKVSFNSGEGNASDFLWAMVAPGLLIVIIAVLVFARLIDALTSIQVVDLGV